MDLETTKQKLRELYHWIADLEGLKWKADEMKQSYDKDYRACDWQGLPPMPKKPSEPRKPSMTPHVEANKRAYTLLYSVPIAFLLLLINEGMFLIAPVCLVLLLPIHLIIRKKKKEVMLQNQRIDEKNAQLKKEYDKACAEHEKKIEAYSKEFKQYELSKNEKIKANRENFIRDNAGRVQELEQMKAQIAQLENNIANCNILSAQDKNLRVVGFVLDKLESGRADSLMMALNMYDDNKRKNDEFQTRLMIDENNRRMERDRQMRAEAEARREAAAFASEMRSIERDRLREQKRAADELEEIRKLAEK